VAVASAGPYASLHLAPDRQPHQHSTTLFLQAGCPSCHPTNSVKALKAKSTDIYSYILLYDMLCTGGIRGDDRAGVDLEIIPDPKFRRLKATVDIALAVKLYYTSQ